MTKAKATVKKAGVKPITYRFEAVGSKRSMNFMGKHHPLEKIIDDHIAELQAGGTVETVGISIATLYGLKDPVAETDLHRAADDGMAEPFEIEQDAEATVTIAEIELKPGETLCLGADEIKAAATEDTRPVIETFPLTELADLIDDHVKEIVKSEGDVEPSDELKAHLKTIDWASFTKTKINRMTADVAHDHHIAHWYQNGKIGTPLFESGAASKRYLIKALKL